MNKKKEGRVYIAVLNYNCSNDTIECIESICDLHYKNFEIILIDNNSTDNSISDLDDYIFKKGCFNVVNKSEDSIKICFLKLERNYGYAGAYNIAIESLVNENGFVWLVNPDMTLDKFSLTHLVNLANSSVGEHIIGTVTNSYEIEDEMLFYGGGVLRKYFGTVKMNSLKSSMKLDYINGNSLFVNIDLFRKYGYFPKEYFLYWEETDWCFTLKKKGVKFLVSGDSIGYDKGGTSIGRGFLAEYYYTRNGLYFTKKHFGYLALTSSLLYLNIRILKWLLRFKIERVKGIIIGVNHFLLNRKGNFYNNGNL